MDASCPEKLIGDAYRLRQIMTNLLSNAIKFTDRGEVRLTLQAKDTGSQRLDILLEVTDSGIGIAYGDLQRLFQPFTQLDGTSTRRFGGTGLGLTICRQLCELMGGEIRVESTVGRGSTFRVVLPMRVFSDGATQEAAVPEGPPSPRTPRDVRVLVAEDNPVNSQVVLAMLESLGYQAEHAGDGLQALDGLEATRQLVKRFPSHFRPKIIGLTANAMQADRDRCSEAGMDAFLTKPVEKQELAAALVSVLNER